MGRILAEEISKTKLERGALVIGLEGELGSGKTTFLQGLAKGMGIEEKVLSPTFIILRKFKIKNLTPYQRLHFDTRQGFKNFYHIDCYRIQESKELLELGFKEIISNSQNIVAVEWADKIKKILPKNSLILKLQLVNKNSRKIWLMKRKN